MREANPIEQLQRRLIELGCPVKAVRKIVRETAEHYEDLQKAALAQGVSEMEAKTRAAELLGEPRQLAERHVEALRNSSWCGRFPLLGFIVAPLALILMFYFLWLQNGGCIPAFILSSATATSDPWIFLFEYYGFFISVLAVTAVLSFIICWQVRRFSVRPRWALIGVSLLIAHGLLIQFQPNGTVLMAHFVNTEVRDPALLTMFAEMPKPDDYLQFRQTRMPAWDNSMPQDENLKLRQEWKKQDEKRWEQLQQMQAHYRELMGVHQAELKHEIMRVPMPSFSDPGWEILVLHEHHTIDIPYTEVQQDNNLQPHALYLWMGNEGQLLVKGAVSKTFSLPTVSYELSWPGPNATLHWINVMMPLLIFFIFQMGQWWMTRRLLGEAGLGGAQLAGVD